MIQNRRRILTLIAIASLGLNTGLIPLPIPWLATTISFFTLLILPGLLLLESLFTRQKPSWTLQLPLAFVLSIGLLSLPTVALLLLKTTIMPLGWIAALLNLTLVALFIWLPTPQFAQNEQTSNHDRGQPHPLLQAILIMATGLTLITFLRTASTWSFGDNWNYLFYIRNYLDGNLNAAITPFLATNDIGGVAYSRATLTAWWVLQALVAHAAHVNLLDMYTIYLPPLLMVLSISAFYSLAHTLFRHANLAAGASILQLLYYFASITSHDWIGRGFFDRLIEDKFLVWFIILPITILLTLHYLTGDSKRYLIPLALGIIALGFTHPLGLVQWGLVVGSFILFRLLLGQERANLTRIFVLTAVLSVFLLAPLAQRQLALASGAFGPISGRIAQSELNSTRLLLFSAIDNLYIAHPHLIAHPLTLLALILTPLLFLGNVRQQIAIQFLLATMIIPLFLIYNPLTAPFIGRFITPWLLWRIPWVLPITLTISYSLYLFMHTIQAQWPHIRRWRWLLAAIAIGLTGVALNTPIRHGLHILEVRQQKTMTTSERELLLKLNELDTNNSVILANPSLNSTIPAFATSANVLTFRWVPANRIASHDTDRFFGSDLLDRFLFHTLKRWSVRYIVIEQTHPLAFQMVRLPTHFALVYSNADYALYEVIDPSKLPPILTANTHYIRGEWAEALTMYDQILVDAPDQSLAWWGKGLVYAAQGQTAVAQTHYQQALTIDPDNALVQLALGDLHVAMGETMTAQSHYQQASQSLPTAFIALGDLALAEGNTIDALNAYQQAVTKDSQTAVYHITLGDLYRQKGVYNAALTAYQQAIALNPVHDILANDNSPDLWRVWQRKLRLDPFAEPTRTAIIGLGQTYQAQGQQTEAIAAYEQAIALDLSQEEAYQRLGDLYLAEEQFAEAVTLYQQAVHRNFNLSWPHVRLGEAYLHQYQAGQTAVWPQMITHLQQAIQLDPEHNEAHALLSQAYLMADQPEAALAVYAEAIATNPNWATFQAEWGQRTLAQGNLESARSALEWAITLNPGYVEAHQWLHDLYQAEQDNVAIITLYQTAIDNNPGYAWPHLSLANIYQEQNVWELALVSYLRAVEIEPRNATVNAQLGNFYQWRQQNPAQAVIFYQRALQTAPHNGWFHAALGSALFKTGQTDIGLAELKLALNLEPTSSPIHELMGQIMIQYGAMTEAQFHFEQAILLDETNLQAYMNLAHLYQQQGDFITAVTHYELALSHLQSNASQATLLYTRLGQTYEALGDRGQSEHYYELANEVAAEE